MDGVRKLFDFDIRNPEAMHIKVQTATLFQVFKPYLYMKSYVLKTFRNGIERE